MSDLNVESSNLTEWHSYSLQQSAGAFLKANIATEEEITTVSGQCIEAWNNNLAAEPLFRLATLEDDDESQYEASIERWGTMLASLVTPIMPPAPFAVKMMTPSAFYEKHEPIYDLARSLKCPILYNEDADVIGLGSINPVTATIFAQALHAYVTETLQISPYITCVRMNYESWKALTEKHFSR
ncbi:hypothetical protein [Rubritalea profundi]|uniref:Uncharacterized protein n=1 Tax=Rubritalea profundi TaxID=1658618 RepID=A0A2S7U511_9BACT|nr:hypothetical protein [Rubritalea profundi]PQJ29263.1 hypothetical protein BSZ32_12680 [Rubritalea profundi]